MSTQNIRALVVEDSDDMRDLVQLLLEEAGYETVTASDGRGALKYIEDDQEFIDVVITDVQMPEVTGHEILAAVRAKRGETPVIVITAFGSVEQAVTMVKSGAFQYLTKPFDKAKLLSLVEKALESSAPHREQARLRRESPSTPARIIGASKPMRELFEQITKVARSMSAVLITGESGTGKELVARAIHDASGRGGAFVPVNCAAIPSELIESEFFGHTGGAFTGAKGARPGLFEAADGGTIFLDEIGELPLMMQPKLLRVLQDAQQLRLHHQWQFADFIQKDRAAIGRFKQPGPRPLGAGEGAAGVAEEFRLDQLRRNGRAVDRHESAAAPRRVVDRAGHEFFARARFAGDEHGAHAARHLGDLL